MSRAAVRWLTVNAAGIALLLAPYVFAAGGVSPTLAAPLSPLFLVSGALIAAIGLLLWLSDRTQLGGTLKRHQVLAILAMVLGIFAVRDLQESGWGLPVLRTVTFKTVVLFLRLAGESVTADPIAATIEVKNFVATVGYLCSGIAGILMVSSVMAGCIVIFRRELEMGRAFLLVPLAAILSWVFNGVRIAALFTIGAYKSPELAIEGFHTHAGWLAFCALAVLMLFAAEKITWFHRRKTPEPPAATAAPNLLIDPAVAQIAPFIVLLTSSLLAGAAFIQPQAGYPLRACLMAGAVLLFWRAYRAEIKKVDAVPVFAGVLVAAVWLAMRPAATPLTITDILGPASQSAIALWVLFRIAGTVLLVPFIEEMFFRGFLLRTLNFGGMAGMAVALTLCSALFGALHEKVRLAAASGIVFGLIALRRSQLFDALAAHAVANAIIAAWALSAGDWSVI